MYRTLRQVFIRVGGMEAAATAAEAVPAAAVQAGGSPLGASSGRRWSAGTIPATHDRGPQWETTGMPEAEAAAAGRAAGSTRARYSTQGSTAAGTTAGITAEGAATIAGITKPPPHGRVDTACFITIFSGTFYTVFFS